MEWSSYLPNELIIGSENGHLTVIDFRQPKETVYSAQILQRTINKISSHHRDAQYVIFFPSHHLLILGI